MPIVTHRPLGSSSCFFFFFCFLVVMGTQAPRGLINGVWGGMGGMFCLVCLIFVLCFSLHYSRKDSYRWLDNSKGVGYMLQATRLVTAHGWMMGPLAGGGRDEKELSMYSNYTWFSGRNIYHIEIWLS